MSSLCKILHFFLKIHLTFGENNAPTFKEIVSRSPSLLAARV